MENEVRKVNGILDLIVGAWLSFVFPESYGISDFLAVTRTRSATAQPLKASRTEMFVRTIHIKDWQNRRVSGINIPNPTWDMVRHAILQLDGEYKTSVALSDK